MKYVNVSTALHLAAENESIQIVRLLLNNKGIDVNITNEIDSFICIKFYLIFYNFHYKSF